MLSIKRLSRKFGKQSLSEVKPAPPSSTVDHTITAHTPHTITAHTVTAHTASPVPREPLYQPSSELSDSDSEEEEYGTKAAPVTMIRKKHLGSTQLKMERVSSAEKRTYRQYKYSIGGNSSSGCSSDDEVREAFEGHAHFHYSPVMKSSLNELKQGSPHSWSIDPRFSTNSRPLKVLAVEHGKPKYFAGMSNTFTERPRLDFNKMQHSKRLVMVRRPLVLRNNSRVHSIPRPPSLEVSLDISAHSFTPVLTQT